MEMIEVSKLKAHPRNNEFFDDITGDNWTEFLKSIETSGVIEPVVISDKHVVISGHQRVKACLELSIRKILCRVKIYDMENTDDIILKELLETNLRQRGIGNTNPIKLARCIVELERIYRVTHGGGRVSSGDNLHLKTQSQLADEIGISRRQLSDYKRLLDLIPEIQELIETEKLSATAGYKIWSKLPQEEQGRLVVELGKDKIAEMTQKQIQEHINKIKGLESAAAEQKKVIAELSAKKASKYKDEDYELLEKENDKLEEKLRKQYEATQKYRREKESKEAELEEALKNQPEVKVVEVIKEVESEKSASLKKQIKQLEDELADARIEIQKGIIVKEFSFDVFKDLCDNFFLHMNGFEFVGHKYEQMSVEELNQFIQTAEEVEQGIYALKNIIGGYINGKEDLSEVS